MRLDINLNFDIAYDCLENLIPPLAKWFGKNYELMSINSWGFEYSRLVNDQEEKLLSKSFSSGTYSNFEYLAKYHGIQLIRHEKVAFKTMVSCIKNELNSKKPVIIYNDSFWCSWYTERYKKIYGTHYCLIIGYESDGLFVIDSQFARNGAFLSYDDFEMGYNDYFICEVSNTNEMDTNWIEILRLSISNRKMFCSNDNMFNALKFFAIDIVEKLDLNIEMNDYKELPSSSPLITKLSNIGKKRRQFSNALNFLSKEYGVVELDVLSKKFLELSNIWSSIFGLLIKAYYTNNDIRLLKKIRDKITKIANEEENIYLEIKSIISLTSFSTNKVYFSSPDPEIKICKYSYVDLINNTNSKGFGYDLDPNNLSEFSDGGRYIYIINDYTSKMLKLNNMSFKLLNKNESYDNISCKEQIIDIKLEPQNWIMFLGCSEWGSHADLVKLIFEDGTKENIPIELTNVVSQSSAYGEELVCVGKYAIKTDNTIDIAPFNANLFAKLYYIKHKKSISEIILPYCPNIHIFAISFGR